MRGQIDATSALWSGFLCRSGAWPTLPWFICHAAPLLAAVLSPAYAGEAAGGNPGNPLWGIPLSHLRVTVERPLFSPLRRQPPPPIAAPPVIASPLPPPRPPEPQSPPLALLATIVGENARIAVFLDEKTKDIVHLKVGQDRAGWTLRAVRSRQVDFQRDRRAATLSLKRDGEDQRPANPPLDVAAPSHPDMESYRAALNRMRGR
jgi:hypothetical protein